MNLTDIEWTRLSLNIVAGGHCQASKGCDNCYANAWAERWRGVAGHPYEFGFDLRLWPDRLRHPHSRRKEWRIPSLVFVCSMSDLFQPKVDFSYIARFWFTAGWVGPLGRPDHQEPWHTFQVLTKRPQRAAAFLRRWADRDQRAAWLRELLDEGAPELRQLGGGRDPEEALDWPAVLPNVWMGTSVEDQAAADLRIPKLADCDAAIRFISAEPLLGEVAVRRWLPARLPMPAAAAPARWSAFEWPAWVVPAAREAVEAVSASPRLWLAEAGRQVAPAFGALLTTQPAGRPGLVSGRFVAGVGREGLVVADDGTVHLVEVDPDRVRAELPLHWVIAGGESGQKARPMRWEWPRALRDACFDAGTPFLYKQNGTFAPQDADAPGNRQLWVDPAGGLHRVTARQRARGLVGADWQRVWRAGKGRAGKELDGRRWVQFPAGPVWQDAVNELGGDLIPVGTLPTSGDAVADHQPSGERLTNVDAAGRWSA